MRPDEEHFEGESQSWVGERIRRVAICMEVEIQGKRADESTERSSVHDGLTVKDRKENLLGTPRRSSYTQGRLDLTLYISAVVSFVSKFERGVRSHIFRSSIFSQPGLKR